MGAVWAVLAPHWGDWRRSAPFAAAILGNALIDTALQVTLQPLGRAAVVPLQSPVPTIPRALTINALSFLLWAAVLAQLHERGLRSEDPAPAETQAEALQE